MAYVKDHSVRREVEAFALFKKVLAYYDANELGDVAAVKELRAETGAMLARFQLPRGMAVS
jgi:hypothetical protein